MTTDMALTTRSLLLRLALAAAIVLCCAVLSRAGGPKCVAGTSYFDPTMAGQPLLWPQGVFTYYTDQGDLSPVLPNASANSLVADAFSQWTSVPTAALAATSGGRLAEDVNGTNVIKNSDGTISMPVDIQSTATGTPIGVVYDYDGSVTNALIGAGAGNADMCFYNAAFGGNDNYGTLAVYQHALIVINGQCAQQSSQLTDVEYRLVRTIGSVLGVGWSQLNVNVQTGRPTPTADDYLGFPVMHFADYTSCVPITRCFSNPYRLSMDDAAAISRLYPVTSQNQSGGKQVFSSTTARIYGSVWFTDGFGNRTTPMQGVNVVARWIDPNTGQPSRRYAAASISGFLYTGNEGNPITGTEDTLGDAYSEWGSTSESVQGFFDLAGLQLPNGGSTQYQLSVEGLDPNWSAGVGPYAPWQVAPSGSAQPITVTVSAGLDVQQDILMSNCAQPAPSSASSWMAPIPVPTGGNWIGGLNGDTEMQFFSLSAKANRTLSVAVTAIDELGNPSAAKLQPVIGMWSASDPEGTPPPALTTSAFNTSIVGLTRLDAAVATSNKFLIGLSDYRGDGRPDFHYRARVLYGDTATPLRMGVGGGPITLRGVGFGPGVNVSVGGVTATPIAVNAGQMVVIAPVTGEGAQDIAITDPVTGASSVMSRAVTFGAAASDNIVLLGYVNPSTPVGTQAQRPMKVRALAADGVTPVAGATIGWSATNGMQLSACNGASSCSATTDQSGIASSWLTPGAVGAAAITATLAPGIYTPAKSVQTTLNGTESSTDIAMVHPYVFVAQGATIRFLVTARVVSTGAPQKNVNVNFSIVSGSGTLDAPSAFTDANGYATVVLSVTQMSALVQVSACVAPSNFPCQPMYATPVPLAQLKLQPVAGMGQVITGRTFQELDTRVVDSASPPNPVLGAKVYFQVTVFRPGGSSASGGDGENNPGNPAMPVILNVWQTSSFSDMDGLVNIIPSDAGYRAPVGVDVTLTTGTSAALDYSLQKLPALLGGGISGRPIGSPPVRVWWPMKQ